MEFDSPKAALERACEIAGGQVALAGLVDTSQSQIWFWLHRSKKGVPGETCVLIEQKTGVPRHSLRPDIFAAPAVGVV